MAHQHKKAIQCLKRFDSSSKFVVIIVQLATSKVSKSNYVEEMRKQTKNNL